MTEPTTTEVDITPGEGAHHDKAPKRPTAFYTAEATATGDGRNGHVTTSDGLLDLELVTPNPITKPKKTNPEQLFASGFAACFNSAFQSAAKLMKVKLESSEVTARVGIGPIALNRFGLGVRLHVTTAGIDQATAESVAEKAEQMCPYSNATRGNIPVEITVSAG
ncbi:organic hydroperoxide resistance protein [Demequina iriomotensis]|uniref:organic hydroperoxide resistance protein n=1 Tax=Demequina iriomotensis TaxID=1536641 RepID=UPI0009E5A57C|nr:organic hydroperoxide resistance protein [Demequina iriomotensis]